jgi:hypothetical protein
MMEKALSTKHLQGTIWGWSGCLSRQEQIWTKNSKEKLRLQLRKSLNTQRSSGTSSARPRNETRLAKHFISNFFAKLSS